MATPKFNKRIAMLMVLGNHKGISANRAGQIVAQTTGLQVIQSESNMICNTLAKEGLAKYRRPSDSSRENNHQQWEWILTSLGDKFLQEFNSQYECLRKPSKKSVETVSS